MQFFSKITLLIAISCGGYPIQAMERKGVTIVLTDRVLRAMQEDEEERCTHLYEELIVLQRSMETIDGINSTITCGAGLTPLLQEEFAVIRESLIKKYDCARALSNYFQVKLLVTGPQDADISVGAVLKSRISIEHPEGSWGGLVVCIALRDLLLTPRAMWGDILDRAFAAWLIEFTKSHENVLYFKFTDYLEG